MARKGFSSNNFTMIGEDHREEGGENEDVIIAGHNTSFEFIILADGVSTCSKAKKGAEIAANAVKQLLERRALYFFNQCTDEQMAEFMVKHMRYELNKVATQEGIDIGEYSSTMAFVVVNRTTKKAKIFNLGNAIIIGVEKDSLPILSQRYDSFSETPVTTTKGVEEIIDTKTFRFDSFRSIIIMSDGACRTLYNRHPRMPQEIKDMLLCRNYEEVKKYLLENASNTFDDASFISLDYMMPQRKINNCDDGQKKNNGTFTNSTRIPNGSEEDIER